PMRAGNNMPKRGAKASLAADIDWREKASWVRDQPVSPIRRNATEGSLSATQSLPARIEKNRGHDPRRGTLPLDGMDRDHLAALPGKAAFEEAERDISSETGTPADGGHPAAAVPGHSIAGLEEHGAGA